ncbi:YihY/virulence factor BrkB family protein [Parasediminibacterium sp. JCM 36343]|uniref:YihY/virulence factor BrkB family protein n=1 Tax=Parasediminibacterium sp. JCM 36343 TaxID=3374279 RepID=UPI00397CB205
MKKFLLKCWLILRESYNSFADNKALRMSAALAYYTIFSIAPMIIVIISLCDFFYGKAAIEGSIYGHLQTYVGKAAALQIEQVIRNATTSRDLTIASIIGVASLIFAATGVFAEIQDSINQIWRLKAKPKKGWLKLIVNRVLSFSMVVSIGFIMLVSLIVSSVLDMVGGQLLKFLPQLAVYVAYGINLFITFSTITLLFAIIFKVLPDARIKWKDVMVGAVATALLFILGKFVIGYYLRRSHVGTTYGAAGSVIVLLSWVYYSAAILYFGAAFTRAYALHKGSNIFPNQYAVWIKEVEMENKESIQADKNAVTTPIVVPPPGENT